MSPIGFYRVWMQFKSHDDFVFENSWLTQSHVSITRFYMSFLIDLNFQQNVWEGQRHKGTELCNRFGISRRNVSRPFECTRAGLCANQKQGESSLPNRRRFCRCFGFRPWPHGRLAASERDRINHDVFDVKTRRPCLNLLEEFMHDSFYRPPAEFWADALPLAVFLAQSHPRQTIGQDEKTPVRKFLQSFNGQPLFSKTGSKIPIITTSNASLRAIVVAWALLIFILACLLNRFHEKLFSFLNCKLTVWLTDTHPFIWIKIEYNSLIINRLVVHGISLVNPQPTLLHSRKWKEFAPP